MRSCDGTSHAAEGGDSLHLDLGWRRIACAWLLWTLVLGVARPPVLAQASEELKIVILEGDGFINNVRKRTARDAVVEVRDRNNKPLAGASVVFLLPSNGPGGAFANGAQSLTVQTNAAGRAVATGLQPNQLTGEFQIQVEARFENQTGRATIRQRNVSRSLWKSWKRWALLGGVVAAVIIVVIVARGEDTTRVGLGTPSVEPR